MTRKCKACGKNTRSVLVTATIVWPQRPSEEGRICRQCVKRSVTMRVVAGLPVPLHAEEPAQRARQRRAGMLAEHVESNPFEPSRSDYYDPEQNE